MLGTPSTSGRATSGRASDPKTRAPKTSDWEVAGRGTVGRKVTGYRPWLDGVRAVAIVLVVSRHLGWDWSSHAGGPAVVLFFALSGYLITGLLLDEHVRGPVDFAGFYVRRAARLLPGLILMLTVCDTWFALHGRHVVRESLSVLFYVKNYRDVIVGGHGLFGQAWSLAVEEHFYLLWPVLLLTMAAKWRRRKVIAATLTLAGVALLWRVSLVALYGTGLWAYIGTFARADSLLIGCALAVAVRGGLRVPPVVMGLSIAVYGWVLSPVWHPQLFEQTIGYTIQSVVCALIVGGLDSVDSRLRRVLSLRPVVLLGIVSYGIYLWHIPVMVATPLDRGPLYDVVVVAVSLALATASYRFVERPARTGARKAHERWRSRRAPLPVQEPYPAGPVPEPAVSGSSRR